MLKEEIPNIKFNVERYHNFILWNAIFNIYRTSIEALIVNPNYKIIDNRKGVEITPFNPSIPDNYYIFKGDELLYMSINSYNTEHQADEMISVITIFFNSIPGHNNPFNRQILLDFQKSFSKIENISM